ncbi:transcriptional regulator [Streptomyces venezuelae]|uniref:Transcriptional regulator n=1 Tax=Streptomyces venezuelae TaxID=54571 RepID=A0A5P2C4Q7_STRVZ|nr:transcriptional regulator [Streptomyces venezuelae]
MVGEPVCVTASVTKERIRRLAVFYSCDDVKLVDALCVIAGESRGQGWWDEYRGVLPPDFLNIAELEHHATCLRSVQTLNVPGVLQTEEYVRALHGSSASTFPAAEVEARVEFRMRRRRIFERDDPPPFKAIVHEAALRMRFGGREVARGQLEYLLEASEWPTVTVRVIPFTNEGFIEVTSPLLYAGGVVPQLDTAQIDSPVGGLFIGAAAELAKYRRLLDSAEQSSLSERESRHLIRRIVREL